MSMFEKATRQKFRFQTKKGNCSVEDLWDLPLKALDVLYRDLNAELRESQEDSLLETQDKGTETLRLKIEIVKHIVQTRQDEQRNKEIEEKKKQENEKIMQIIEEKEEGNLREKSIDELKTMLANR